MSNLATDMLKSCQKIEVFLFVVLSVVMAMGALMYVIEGP